METSLLILLGTTTFYFYSIDKPVEAALCGSLSLLTRPDALLFFTPPGNRAIASRTQL